LIAIPSKFDFRIRADALIRLCSTTFIFYRKTQKNVINLLQGTHRQNHINNKPDFVNKTLTYRTLNEGRLSQAHI